jgi:branched-chain amino acid transport system ATP-binding protein
MLEVQNLNAWWGQAQALFDVSLRVGAGELVVLQGLNGAGKSTLLQAIMGLGSRCTATVICQLGSASELPQRIDTWPPHRRAQLGLGYVAEDRRLWAALSVHDNLTLAARGSRTGQADNLQRVFALFPALQTMLQRPASQMSGGEQQMLAIARTLMTSPRFLLLDEPCEGIAPVLVESIAQALWQLKQEGMAMLVAEQNQVLASRADRVITLVAGQVHNAP